MESWRRVWRVGLAPLLSVEALAALRKALVEDDQRLIQGATSSPPPIPAYEDFPCGGCCLLGYLGWQGEGLETVGEVGSFFAAMCYRIDQRVGEPSGVRWLLNEYDEWPRDTMRAMLLPEVDLALSNRGGI